MDQSKSDSAPTPAGNSTPHTTNGSGPEYVIPAATLAEWHRLSSSSGLPYATIVGQHVYDLEGEIKVVEAELAGATGPAPTSATAVNAAGATTTTTATYQTGLSAHPGGNEGKNGGGAGEVHSSQTKLAHKLALLKAQLMAYQREQATGGQS